MTRKRVNDVLRIEGFLEHYYSCVLAWSNKEKDKYKTEPNKQSDHFRARFCNMRFYKVDKVKSKIIDKRGREDKIGSELGEDVEGL
jgi:hypothetical protein